MNTQGKISKLDGSLAVLGLDLVAFSTMRDEDQIQAIQHLYRWITEALANHSIGEHDYRWSPAGDGGYLTFNSGPACRKAIDVAFTICSKVKIPDWKPGSGVPVTLRMGLHAGLVTEEDDLGRKTNIWGLGINTASRIVAVSAENQLLVSKQYFDTYIQGMRENDFQIGELHWRTVKHGVGIEVMNVNRQDLCLTEDQAAAKRWQSIGGLWQKTIQHYTFLIHDAMKSGDPVAALAAGKFLLELDADKPVRELCQMIGQSDFRPSKEYPPQTHILFSQMPPDLLFKVLEQAEPRLFKRDELIFKHGDPATSCIFPVSGTVVVEVPGHDKPIPIPKGQMTGEFTLWIPRITRTANVRAMDDGLFLEIHNDRFRVFLEDTPDVANVIFGIIRRRIMENVLTARQLFPQFVDASKQDVAQVGAVCKKFEPGQELDLTENVHILFNGKVEVNPEDGGTLVIQAAGKFGGESVVGIISDIGTPDGDKARVLEDTVSVMIPRQTLRRMQEENIQLSNAWNSICGMRLGQIRLAAKAVKASTE